MGKGKVEQLIKHYKTHFFTIVKIFQEGGNWMIMVHRDSAAASANQFLTFEFDHASFLYVFRKNPSSKE